MEQIAGQRYTVRPGEEVRGTVVGINVSSGGFALTLDESPLTPAADGRFSFGVTKSPGETHVLVISPYFGADAPDDARYDFTLVGSAGGHGRISLRKRDTVHEATLTFLVRDSSPEEFEPEEEADPPIIIGGEGIAPPRPWD